MSHTSRSGDAPRRGALRRGAVLALGATALMVSTLAARASEAPDVRRADPSAVTSSGIWKAVVPPGAMHGEFGNNDPLGLAAGVAIPADCSINWVDPDAGKLYCFSSATSLVVFLDSPHAYLKRAQAQWTHLEKSLH
jgi:hypothetical protein